MKNRVKWVDLVKYICIMFVMLSHLECCTLNMRKFFSPFFLSGFFFVSGYVYRDGESFKEHIIKKFKGLFIPWFLFSNINILLSSFITLKGDRNIIREILINLLQIRGYGDGIWFVAALFMAFIPFYFFVKIQDIKISTTLSFILALLSSIYAEFYPKDILPWGSHALPWHLEYVFIAMFWMILGYYYKQQFEQAIGGFEKKYFTLLILLLYMIIVFIPLQVKIPFLTIMFTYIKSLLGIVLIVLLSKHIKSNRYFAYVGANTLIYFALHGKLYAVLEWLLSTRLSSLYNKCLNNPYYSSLLAIILTLLMSAILIVPAYCINRWLPWIVGREKRKN